MAASQVSREPERGEGVIPPGDQPDWQVPCQEILSLGQQSEEDHYQVTEQIQLTKQIAERSYGLLILTRS